MFRVSFLWIITFIAITSLTPIQFLAAEEMTLDDCASIALRESEKVKASGMAVAMPKYDGDAVLISAFPKMYIETHVLKLDFSGVVPMEFSGVTVSIPMPNILKRQKYQLTLRANKLKER